MNIEAILSYIPYFENNHSHFYDIVPAKENKDGSIILGWYAYASKLNDFISVCYDSDVLDPDYFDKLEKAGFNRQNHIELLITADLETTLALLTGYVRQERFNDGLWARCCDERIFLHILKRLEIFNTEA